MKTVAIIPAGGVGRRMGTEIPKQYLLLAGIPILAHTLQAFQCSPVIDEIVLIVPEADMTEVRQSIVEKYGLSKVGLILSGGTERQDSVRNGLQQVSDEHELIVIHDAVRPFVSADLISSGGCSRTGVRRRHRRRAGEGYGEKSDGRRVGEKNGRAGRVVAYANAAGLS